MKLGRWVRFYYEYQRNCAPVSPFSAPSARMLEFTSKSDLSSNASISASSMTSTPSLVPGPQSGVGPKRKQNLHHGRYNGPNSKSDTHDGRWPLSFIRFNSMRD
jgi:hypothetical protein